MASQALVFEQSPIEDESFQVCKSQKEVEHEQLLEKVEAKVEKAVVSAQQGQQVVEKLSSSLTSSISNSAKSIKDAVGKPLRQIENNTQFSGGKSSSIELRAMYKDLDPNEAIRQIENAIQVFNPSASEVDWLSNIIQRELSKFEKVERQRLSLEVLGGLVEKERVQEIIQTKLRMVILGALQHSSPALRTCSRRRRIMGTT
jgi:hypothetical protein